MKILHSLMLTVAVVAVPSLAKSKQEDSSGILVKKDLSPGVELLSVDGSRHRFARDMSLDSGTHIFVFTYAYDERRDQNGRWVSRLTYKCVLDSPGTYTLRSKDSRVGDQVPTIWIESNRKAPPECSEMGV